MPNVHVDPEVQLVQGLLNCPLSGSFRAPNRPPPIGRWSKCTTSTSKIPEEPEREWLDPARHCFVSRVPVVYVIQVSKASRHPGLLLTHYRSWNMNGTSSLMITFTSNISLRVYYGCLGDLNFRTSQTALLHTKALAAYRPRLIHNLFTH